MIILCGGGLEEGVYSLFVGLVMTLVKSILVIKSCGVKIFKKRMTPVFSNPINYPFVIVLMKVPRMKTMFNTVV